MENVLVKIVYFGGTHGAFLRYFIDRFSNLTPEITQSPFCENGTSHSSQVNYSGRVIRETLENINGETKNNFKIKEYDVPHILITVEAKDILHHMRFMLLRDGDHEFVGTPVVCEQNRVLLSNRFCSMYGDKIKKIYNIDVRSGGFVSRSILRDFLKIDFLNPQKNQILLGSQENQKYLTPFTYCLPMGDLYDWGLFSARLAEADARLGLSLDLGDQARQLHREFLSRLSTADTLNRAHEIITQVNLGQDRALEDLDVVEEAYIAAWMEKNYEFVLTPLTDRFFATTAEIRNYLKNYPQHYKAMNPNMAQFCGRDNPFYLWGKNKLK